VTQRDVLTSVSVTGALVAGLLYVVGHCASAARLNFDLCICIHVYCCRSAVFRMAVTSSHPTSRH